MSRFSALEWTVVAFARKEPLRSIEAPAIVRRTGRLLRWLVAAHAWTQLADARLETLRRTAIVAWHRKKGLRPADRAAFVNAGFSDDQLNLLVQTCGPKMLVSDAVDPPKIVSPSKRQESVRAS
jgi:hypothetical protein